MHRNTLLHATTLADLIVSDERRAWILENYPPGDVGRPGLLVREVSRMARTIFKQDRALTRLAQEDEPGDSEVAGHSEVEGDSHGDSKSEEEQTDLVPGGEDEQSESDLEAVGVARVASEDDDDNDL